MVRSLLSSLILCLGLFGCGGSSLDQPQELPTTVYPANMGFRLTLVMKTCSDSCATYEPGTCSYSLDGSVLSVDASVSYERTGDTCNERCGAPVLVHCDIEALAPGEYTVESGSFLRQITVR